MAASLVVKDTPEKCFFVYETMNYATGYGRYLRALRVMRDEEAVWKVVARVARRRGIKWPRHKAKRGVTP